jgi:hypothetical protein
MTTVCKLKRDNLRQPKNLEEKYGMLTPVSYLCHNKHSKAIWKFKCDCGGEKICVFSDVKFGRTQSCGCLQKMNSIQNGFLRTITLEETQFKEFFVLNRNLEKSCTGERSARYICKCKCGKIFERKGTSIHTGKTKRCRTCQNKHNGMVTKEKLRINKESMINAT